MKEIINFNTKFNDLSKVNPLVSRYKMFIAYADEPANNYIFSKEVLDNMSFTIKGCPVVAGFMNEKDGSLLGGHEGDYAVDETNRIKPTPTPIPVGFAAYDVEPWWEEYDGKSYYTTFVYIWDGRYPELENLSERKIFQSMEVSVENDQEGKFKIVKESYALGLCLLENVEPAFKNSHIEKFTFNSIKSEVDLLKQEFENYSKKYDDLDFSIPSGVKKAAQNGLDLRKEYGRGGTSVGLAIARYLVKNTIASPEKVRHIAKYFSRHANDNLDENGKNGKEISNGYIAWQLLGSDAGRRWSTKLVEAMNRRDEEKMSYFLNDNSTINSVFIDNINLTSNKSKGEGDSVIEEAVKKFSLNSSQIHEILGNALSEYKYGENGWKKYWVNCFDDTYAYVNDSEDDKNYRIKYTISENVATMDMESKEEVIRGSYIPVSNNSLGESFSVENMVKAMEEIKYTKENQEMCKYTYISHDENYCYAMDMEHEKMMAIPYLMEEENMKMDFDGCKMAKVKLMAKSDDDASDSDDIYMSLKNMFSSNVYVDNNAMQELNDKAAENNKQLSEEQMKEEDDKDKIIAGMSKELNEVKNDLSKIKSDIKAYAEENKKLKDFKASVEKQNKDFEVETTLNEVMSILPKEEIDTCRMSAENFNLENIDIWKNEVQAKAFKFSKGIIEKQSYIKVGLPESEKPKTSKGLWD